MNDDLSDFIALLQKMGVQFHQQPLMELHVVEIPLPQRKTEGILFVFKDGKYYNHRVQKIS